MSSTREDVFARLSLVIEDWDAQITRSHDELSNQIGVARSHLDRLLQPKGDRLRLAAAETGGLDEPPAIGPERAGAITRLEAEVARLSVELEAARAAVSPPEAPTGGNGSDVAELEEALGLAREELAARSAAVEALERKLGDATEEIEVLATRLRETGMAMEAPASDNDTMALRAALEMLQLEHAQAQDEIRSLKQALDGQAGSGVRTGTGEIDAFDARGHKKRMGDILVGLGVLTEVQLKTLLKEQAADPQRRLGTLAVEHGFIGEHLVARILAAQLRLPYQDLADAEIEQRAMDAVSPHVVRLHRCLPLREADGVLTVAMVNPLDLIAIEDLELASRCRVAPVVSTPSAIDALLLERYPDAP